MVWFASPFINFNLLFAIFLKQRSNVNFATISINTKAILRNTCKLMSAIIFTNVMCAARDSDITLISSVIHSSITKKTRINKRQPKLPVVPEHENKMDPHKFDL